MAVVATAVANVRFMARSPKVRGTGRTRSASSAAQYAAKRVPSAPAQKRKSRTELVLPWVIKFGRMFMTSDGVGPDGEWTRSKSSTPFPKMSQPFRTESYDFLGYRSPNLNAYVERSSSPFKWSVWTTFRYLARSTSTIGAGICRALPHREAAPGLANRLVSGEPPPAPLDSGGEVLCQARLGGLPKHYYRVAATPVTGQSLPGAPPGVKPMGTPMMYLANACEEAIDQKENHCRLRESKSGIVH